MARPHRIGQYALLAVVCLSVRLSRAWFYSRMEGRRKLENWQEGSPSRGWLVTPFRGRKVKGQDNKITSQNTFSFEARHTTGGATWWI